MNNALAIEVIAWALLATWLWLGVTLFIDLVQAHRR